MTKEGQDLIILTEFKLIILQIHLKVGLLRITSLITPQVSMDVGKPLALYNGL